MFRTHLCKSAMHRFFFFIFYFFKTAESHQSAASRSVLSSLIIAGVIEIKRGSRGGEVRAGRDTHEWRKIQTISTILKFQFSSEAPRFSLAGPEGKKQTKKKTLLELLFICSSSASFSLSQIAMKKGCVAGGRGVRSESDADDLGIRSRRYRAAPRRSEHFCLFVCLFWSTSSFIRLNAHRSFSPPFPCSRTFHNMLVVTRFPSLLFFCFVSECACSEVVHLLISNPIPCLLSMHSERVFVFLFFTCQDSVAVVSRQCVLSFFFHFYSTKVSGNKYTNVSFFLLLQEYIPMYHFASEDLEC